MSDQEVIGKKGLLTSPISAPEKSGAIVIQVRGGAEEFIAVASEAIAKNVEVEVVNYYPPRTVVVSPTSKQQTSS